jgi:hypothetical protein
MTAASPALELCLAYMLGKRRLIQLGFAWEIDWQDDADPMTATEPQIIREGAWAILSCGLSARAVGSVFPRISRIFGHWAAPANIVENRDRLIQEAHAAFGHPAKLRAIVDLTELVASLGGSASIELLGRDPAAFAERVAFLGPVSTRHMMKSLGFPVAKPDRHMVRLADALGTTPTNLCATIASVTHEKVAVVDLVLWRLSELRLVGSVFDIDVRPRVRLAMQH